MRDRARDYCVLLIVFAFLSFPNLGVPTLWDMDEGVNAQTSREMQSAGTWIIPTFNYHLRTAKPVMLYWLQRLSYDAFGISEWSARLPSVLAGLLATLLVYELATRMFGRATGLLAGLILASVAQVAMIVHAATPDATLLAFTILTFFAFWTGHQNGGRRWWYWMAAADGLAFLTKGPIGVVIPALVLFLYFAWNRELRRLLDRRFFAATFIFLLIAAPWYTLVSTETRGEWIRVFLTRENYERFTSVMDRHAGWFGYYLLIVPLMFAPWSAFLIPLFWYGWKGARGSLSLEGEEATTGVPQTRLSRERLRFLGASRGLVSPHSVENPGTSPLGDAVRANRLLLCWVMAYFLFFSAAATKLPNYILPIYPAMAILTARYLVGWRDNLFPVARWMPTATVGGTTLIGVGAIACILLGAQTFPALTYWTAIALIPLAGAATMCVCLRRNNRKGVVNAVTIAFILFIGVAVAFPATVLEPYKAPKDLVRMSGVADPSRDIRVGQFEWLLPSVVYYSGREARSVPSEEKVVEFLSDPTPAYLFVMENTWNTRLEQKVKVPVRVAARHHDFLGRCEVVVITNEIAGVPPLD